MKVLFISHSWPTLKHPYWGCFIKESINHIAKKGIDVEVISPKPFLYDSRIPEQDLINGYKIFFPRYFYWIPKKWFYHKTSGGFERLAKRILKDCQKPDLVHAQTSFLDASLGRVLSEIWNVPLVIHARGTLERQVYFENNKVKAIMDKNFGCAKKIVCVSEELARTLMKIGYDKMYVIPNGVDIKEFILIDKVEARKRIGIPLDKKVILFVGDLKKEKGIEYFCQTAEKIKDENILFYVVGEGKLSSIIRFEGKVKCSGFVPHEEIKYWLNATDILVVPSLTEGRPNVILEALSCGTPIIGTNVGGIPELLENTGILVPPRDSNVIVEKIMLLLNDSRLRGELSKKSIEFINTNKLLWEDHAQKMVNLYEELIT